MVRHAWPAPLLMMLFVAPASTRSQQPVTPDDIGLTGAVLGPDGKPVTGGTVYLAPGNPLVSSNPNRGTTPIDRTGHFRVVPATAGFQELVIVAPGLATHRVNVTVPPSKTMKLPAMNMSLPTFFRVRFVTADGEPILSPQVRRDSLDAYGARIAEPPEVRSGNQIDGEGTITIGPLPRGVTTLALDMPPFAQLRLPDLYVTGAEPLLDGGTVIIQPGATLHVDLTDARGAPVPGHDVRLEDALPLSPFPSKLARTNQKGRASFERLSAGRYRVQTRALGPCVSGFPLTLTRVVAVAGTGSQRTRMILEGTAAFRLSSVFGPLRGASVLVSAESSPGPPPQWLRSQTGTSRRFPTPLMVQPSCRGATDGDGRVALTIFPPGPARVEVQQLNSRFVRRVSIPDDGRELAIVVPDGFLPLRVISALKNAPVVGAEVAWIGSGGRVEARTNALGEALLEGVGILGGTLSIRADGFEPGEEQLAEPPTNLHEVALIPLPPTRIELRVVNASGQPVRDAVVELAPANAIEIGHIAATDAKGVVTFSNLPGGVLRLTATADGYRPATVQVPEDKRALTVLTLSRVE